MPIVDVGVELYFTPAGPAYRRRDGLPGSDPEATGAALRAIRDNGREGIAFTGRGAIPQDLPACPIRRGLSGQDPLQKEWLYRCMAIPNTTFYESLVRTNPVVRAPEIEANGLIHAPTAPGMGWEASGDRPPWEGGASEGDR